MARKGHNKKKHDMKSLEMNLYKPNGRRWDGIPLKNSAGEVVGNASVEIQNGRLVVVDCDLNEGVSLNGLFVDIAAGGVVSHETIRR